MDGAQHPARMKREDSDLITSRASTVADVRLPLEQNIEYN